MPDICSFTYFFLTFKSMCQLWSISCEWKAFDVYMINVCTWKIPIAIGKELSGNWGKNMFY